MWGFKNKIKKFFALMWSAAQPASREPQQHQASAAPGQPAIDYIMITAGQQPQQHQASAAPGQQQQHQASSRPGPAKPAAIPLIWVLFGVCRR